MTTHASVGQRRCGRFLARIIVAGVILMLLPPRFGGAQQDERSVRAAFVYNLTKYVTWPTANRELNVCVLGEGSTGLALKQVVDGKASGGRVVRVILRPSDLEMRRCDIVYFSDSTDSRTHSLLGKPHGSLVLTVGEDDRFVREGGMVGFVRSGDSIRIEVNLDAVNAGGLKISSRLLDLALLVHSGKRG